MTYTLTADIEAILDSSADALATLAGSHVFIAGAGGFLGKVLPANISNLQ